MIQACFRVLVSVHMAREPFNGASTTQRELSQLLSLSSHICLVSMGLESTVFESVRTLLPKSLGRKRVVDVK